MTTTPTTRRHIGGGSNRAGLAAIAAALVVIVHLRTGNFATYDNVTSILTNTAAILLASIAVARLLVAGAVDLSLGGMYALIAVIAATVARDTGSAELAIFTGLLLGAALGAINGLAVRLFHMSSIIVTLAIAAIYRGLAMVITDARSVTGLPDRFVGMGRSKVFGVPSPVVISLLCFTIGAVALTRSVGGVRSYAIGGNPAASRLAGVRVHRHQMLLYAYVGASMGAVALLGTSRLGSGTPTIGTQFEIDVLTAVVLGGVAFNGGRGRPIGVFVGVVTIGVVNAAMIFLGLSSFFQQIAKGAVLLLALGADQVVAARRRRSGPTPIRHVVAPSASRPEVLSGGSALEADSVAIAAHGLTKSYGAVAAVADASFDVRVGQVVCLVGDNGAGKSTVIRMLTGVERPDRGTISLAQAPVSFTNPGDARAAGIEVVHQDLALCPNLGAAHNLVLGREPRRSSLQALGSLAPFDRRAAIADAHDRLAQLDVTLTDLLQPVGELSGGQRQAVAISRVIRDGVRVVILDEPTAALGVSQTRSVLRLVRTLAARGVAVVMVTHDVQAVLDVSDQVVVLNLGRVTFSGATASLTDRDLVQLMAGLPIDRSPAVTGAAR